MSELQPHTRPSMQNRKGDEISLVHSHHTYEVLSSILWLRSSHSTLSEAAAEVYVCMIYDELSPTTGSLIYECLPDGEILPACSLIHSWLHVNGALTGTDLIGVRSRAGNGQRRDADGTAAHVEGGDVPANHFQGSRPTTREGVG
jgi:hypothetical protein